MLYNIYLYIKNNIDFIQFSAILIATTRIHKAMKNPNFPFGNRLQRERKNHKDNQTTIANLFGISQPTVTAWEKGKSEPCLEDLVTLADHLGVSTDYLLGRTEDRSLHVSGPIQNVVGANAHDNAQSIALSSGGGSEPCPECARKDAEIARLTRECERLSREAERAAAGVK